ncbi:hypothetical protein [Sediminibacterium sp.]|uniref:hypothetical protein n=1 Tax=Sediminibacterium sp. TaxID=1917865 RepID=UPI00273607BD|nr:hypothetical protein [Sediminibacterium sp.]MDP3394073.1 hypothetical protein [Sediminibacterium sp.]MDP3566338.1 hypothetical protein [Sediminibacterium sp.]
MTKQFFFVLISILMVQFVVAQQALPKGEMSFTAMTKPNNIVFNDSIYKGSNQFKQLFYRTGNPEIIQSFQKHQSNKITGQVLSFSGAIALLIGINNLSGSNKGMGWTLIGSGFVASLAGGYFTLVGQNHLLSAVDLFNNQYKKSTVSLGLGKQSAGLVYKF